MAELKETTESIKAELDEKPSHEEPNDNDGGDENKSKNFIF